MTNRQSQFLKDLIERYTVKAEPVASSLLAEKSGVSSATVRNEMAALEEDGFILQPHTSAGRIPTVKGYKHYLENFLKPTKPSANQKKKIEGLLKSDRPIKSIAKELAEMTDNAVLVALANNDFYYTGLSKLFAQPEFCQHQEVINISSVLDALDNVLEDLYDTVEDQVKILVGEENPFSPQCSLLVSSAKLSKNDKGVMAVLGPVRMNYNKNVGLLDYSKMILNNNY